MSEFVAARKPRRSRNANRGYRDPATLSPEERLTKLQETLKQRKTSLVVDAKDYTSPWQGGTSGWPLQL